MRIGGEGEWDGKSISRMCGFFAYYLLGDAYDGHFFWGGELFDLSIDIHRCLLSRCCDLFTQKL